MGSFGHEHFRRCDLGVGYELTLGSILCGDLAIKLTDEPFVSEADDQEEWTV